MAHFMLEMAADTDYTEFQNSIDTTITCAAGDDLATPSFMYLGTVASYSDGGGTGGQNSGGPASESFDETLAAGAFYVVTITGTKPNLVVSGDLNVTSTTAPGGAPAPTGGSPANASAPAATPGSTPTPAPTPSKSEAKFFGRAITTALLLGMTFILS
jgi:hypothetical protein